MFDCMFSSSQTCSLQPCPIQLLCLKKLVYLLAQEFKILTQTLKLIALSPKTLLTTNRFVCEICIKGFQRDQFFSFIGGVITLLGS
ncbi:hypothetical protein NC653_005505 [Populus alba x Populus x berolinensis]|uniref:Uncharacterized protein n=1 Tax=Populus alba x Populus x berolinensis TaxID=444605 RepID=A0AAD6RCC6_9ROSI|nr:hypothetical protein NC653_005505 [Populus alba x Populus x berolinensis]